MRKRITAVILSCFMLLFAAASCGDPAGGDPAASELPAEIMPLLENYYMCNIMYDLPGIQRSYYPQDLEELMEKAGVFEGMDNIFSPPKQGELKPGDLRLKITGVGELSQSALDAANSTYDPAYERYGSALHTITDSYRLELTYYDRNIESECSGVTGVALMDGTEWVILPLNDTDLDSQKE